MKHGRKLLALLLALLMLGSLGMTAFAEGDEQDVTITYTKGEGGTVSLESETIAAGGTATGSTAKADEGYIFVNWTHVVGEETVEDSTEAAFVPQKNADGVYAADTYTANFEKQAEEPDGNKTNKETEAANGQKQTAQNGGTVSSASNGGLAHQSADEEGTIEAITGTGTVSGSDISVANATLEWAAADNSIGRYQDGWWVGVRIVAPASVTDDTISEVKYSNDGTDTLAKEFAKTNDKKNDAGRYILNCWLPVTQENLETALANNNNLSWTYKFDWNGDGTADQTFNITVDPRNVTLNKDGVASCKTENGVMTIKDGAPVVAWNVTKGMIAYTTLSEAITGASDGDTIKLGEGRFTTYGNTSPKKSLTFVGQGTDKTYWGIGATIPDPSKFGTEYNGDYSFDGCENITFKNMTLQSGTVDYLGFIRINNTVVEDCVISGKTFYWGYQTATFKNTTFNCPNGDYAIWTYSSPVMTFDGCTFNSSGKMINVYTDYGAGKNNITVNFNGCTVNNSAQKKAVMKINDSNMGDYKYIINITGTNTINNVITSEIASGSVTCSKLFGFDADSPAQNSGRTGVYINDTLVWTEGKMVAHDMHDVGYTDGQMDDAFTYKYSDWTINENGAWMQTIDKICNYCGYTETSYKYKFTLSYDANGGSDAPEKWDSGETSEASATTNVSSTMPTLAEYTFKGWSTEKDGTAKYKPLDGIVLTKDTVLYAVWEQNPETTYTLSYDANKGKNAPAAESVTTRTGSGVITVSSSKPSRTGYVFKGWSTTAGGSVQYVAGDEITLDADMTLYAVWTAKSTSDVKTGDESNLALWLALAGVSLAGVAAAVIYTRKKRGSAK